MNGSATKALFWWAIVEQVVGAQVFFWDALPNYRELTDGAVVVGSPKDFAVAVFDLVIMQSAYCYARRLQPQVRFRHRVLLGHVLLCVSEVSFFFVSALATVAAVDHWKRSQFVLWKALLLVSAIFASSAINVSSPVSGTPCWRHNLSMPKKQRSNRKEPANYEKVAANEFPAFGKVVLSLTATKSSLDSPRNEVSSNSIRRAS